MALSQRAMEFQGQQAEGLPLQALLPIPPAILALGPTDKEVIAWLMAIGA